MIKPDGDTLIAIALLNRHNPVFVAWLKGWRIAELDKLPLSTADKTPTLQGRVQILTELISLIDKATEITNKPKVDRLPYPN